MSPTVIAITPGDGRELAPWIRALGEAGLDALVIREPGLPAPQADALVTLAQQHVPEVIIHARTSTSVAAQGRHLTAAGPQPTEGPWGRSCHSREAVEAALAAGARWAFLSPVWRPTSKPGDRRPVLGLTPFLDIARGRPVYALGGVTPERHHRLMARGGTGSAVLGDLFGQPTPSAAGDRLREYYSLAKMKISGS